MCFDRVSPGKKKKKATVVYQCNMYLLQLYQETYGSGIQDTYLLICKERISELCSLLLTVKRRTNVVTVASEWLTVRWNAYVAVDRTYVATNSSFVLSALGDGAI